MNEKSKKLNLEQLMSFSNFSKVELSKIEMNRLFGGDGDPGTDITAPDTPIYIKE
jgi:natural product precursor